MNIEKNKVVTIQYVLKNEDQQILDSSEQYGDLPYIQGRGNLIPGLEAELEGKRAGDSFSVVIPPKEAYGEFDESLKLEIPKENFQGIKDLQPGMQIQVNDHEQIKVMSVKEITDTVVIMDANHPLAGQTLYFDVNVVDVRDATPEEIAHGHIHQSCNCSDDSCSDGGCSTDGCSC